METNEEMNSAQTEPENNQEVNNEAIVVNETTPQNEENVVENSEETIIREETAERVLTEIVDHDIAPREELATEDEIIEVISKVEAPITDTEVAVEFDLPDLSVEPKEELAAEDEIKKEVSKEVPHADTEEEVEVDLPDLSVDPSALANEPLAIVLDEDAEDINHEAVGIEEREVVEIDERYDTFSREQLLDSLEKLVQEVDVNAIKSKVVLIKVAYLNLSKEEKQKRQEKFLAEGGKKEEFVADDMIDEQFNAAFNIYKEKKNKYNEEQEKQKLKNLEEKNRILEELKNLINSEETLKKTYDEFRVLQDSWKQIGMVPKSEINGLWQNYHFLVEKFFDKVKINKELKDLDLKKNLENKISLCEKVEELLLETSIVKSFKQLQKLHEEWKEIGPVPSDKKDEIWERFKTASDKINDRRREFFNTIQDEQQNNIVAKTLLCEKAEELLTGEIKSLKEWQDKTNQVNELLKIWKTIGPASPKFNNEIWHRFRTSLEGFFTNKREYYGKLKDQQINNFNLKLDLCVQAEALKTSTDWAKTTREFINLQNEWKKVGPVSRKNSEKIWKRFRAACDEFFNNKSTYFSSVKMMEQENLKQKEELIKKVQEFTLSDDRATDLENLKDMQRQWMDIGHVPMSEKDHLQNEFRTLINKLFDKLRATNNEISTNYKNRFENVKSSPEAGKLIGKERNFLAGKLSKLQEEIMLWENNIGFLANSKNANILKEEFEKKINSAKEEVKLLEEKLKFLRTANNN